MRIDHIPFHTTDWEKVETTEHLGERGFAKWKTLKFGDVRLRMVEYSAGYVADHWCNKGHFIFCLEGEMVTELKDGRKLDLKKGMTYQVGDNMEEHRSSSKDGCKLFIVD